MDSRDKIRFATKCICLPFLCLIATGTSLGQESQGSAAPNIEILQLKWDREVRLPRNFDPSVIPTGTTFTDPSAKNSVPLSTTEAKNPPSGLNTAAGTSLIGFPTTPGRLPVFYVYSMKIRNSTSKPIEGIAWDCLFIDPNSNTELGRHQFVSYAKIAEDKSVTLQGKLRSPPVRVVRISESSKNTRPKFIERAVIQCVLYADDTVWRNPSGRDGVCELLKNGKAPLKGKRGASKAQ